MAITFSSPAKQLVALGANTSLETSQPWLVSDFGRVTISVQTGAAAASRITIVASNLDGFTSGLSSADKNNSNNTWVQHMAFTGQGVFSVTTIPRWIMAIRDTSNSGQTASNITVIFSGNY